MECVLCYYGYFVTLKVILESNNIIECDIVSLLNIFDEKVVRVKSPGWQVFWLRKKELT